jgi:hemoglobin
MPPLTNLPPITSFPHPAIFQALGAEGIRDLLRAVYQRLGTSSIAGLFPKEAEALQNAADKSALFFVGICGGPPLYEQAYGAPKMRLRHANFAITDEARVVWLSCWEEVLKTAPETLGFPREHLNSFRDYLVTFSKWMVNT